MTERERTIIRVVGLIVHAWGAVWLFVALTGWPFTLGIAPGVLAFLVGGAWGWGMVWAAARQDERDRLAAAAQGDRRRRGFSAEFDDEDEHLIVDGGRARIPLVPPPPVPPGPVGGP